MKLFGYHVRAPVPAYSVFYHNPECFDECWGTPSKRVVALSKRGARKKFGQMHPTFVIRRIKRIPFISKIFKFTKYVSPKINARFPKLSVEDIVEVQPMQEERSLEWMRQL